MLARLFSVFIFLVFINSTVLAETYTREYTYKASEADSKLTCRTIALDQIKLLLLQEIGTHIYQEINITKDGYGNSYASEDVNAVTAGLTKVDVMEERWDGVTYYLKAEIEADSDQIINALNEFKTNKNEDSRQQLEMLKNNQRDLKVARDEIFRLKEALAVAKTDAERHRIGKKYPATVDDLQAVEMNNKGFKSDSEGNYTDAAYWFQKASDKGLAASQFNLGRLYLNGKGVKEDLGEAFRLFQKAANHGIAAAQTTLASMYFDGEGVTQDYNMAVVWTRKAAEQGNLIAQYNLGVIYLVGKGVEKNEKKAVQIFKKASDQGHAGAMYYLGKMHYLAIGGLKQNRRVARDLMELSCERGYRQACFEYFTIRVPQ